MESRLKRLREKRGLSQAGLAKIAGINLRAYQTYEQERRNISKAGAETIIRICLGLDCKASDIVTDEETRITWLSYENAVKRK